MEKFNSIEDLYCIANNNDAIQKVVENDTLFGRFSHYAKEPLTQEDIDDCLAEVAYLQDLRIGKNTIFLMSGFILTKL
ncbi:MAG: hypothetical protein Q4D68_02210 [Moraxella equi]|nr:hypothetical protein [Moraxella equi]